MALPFPSLIMAEPRLPEPDPIQLCTVSKAADVHLCLRWANKAEIC